MANKKRADLILFEQGKAKSQDMAARLIMSGQVFIRPSISEASLRLPDGSGFGKAGISGAKDFIRVDKPGTMLPKDADLLLKEKDPYVSRGAYKLLTALEHFKLNVTGLTALDAGASTGGFTDCLLQRGAARVYAVDVGANQLHEKLKNDSRVVSMEGVNLRLAGAGLLPEQVDLVVADVSFISLKAILPPCLQYLKPEGQVVALIKPQFEVGANQTVKGVVHDPERREDAVKSVLDFALVELGLSLQGVVPSAITGHKGNQEYLAAWKKCIT